MRITVHARGGFSVYNGHYDPHKNEAILQARTGETVAVTAEFPDAPTSPTVSATGATVTTPAASGKKVSFAVSGFNDGARIDLTATVGDEIHVVRIRVRSDQTLDGYDLAASANGDGTLDFSVSDNSDLIGT